MIVFLDYFFLAVLITVIVFFIVFTKDTFINDAPAIFSSEKSLKKLFESISIPEGSRFLDIGSGDGRVLAFFLKMHKGSSAVGIERGYLPFFLSLFKLRNTKAKVYRGNVFSQKGKTLISEATHIFVYLYPEMIERLAPLFEDCLEKGAVIIALDFPLPGRNHSQVVDLQKGREVQFYEFGKVVYMYKK